MITFLKIRRVVYECHFLPASASPAASARFAARFLRATAYRRRRAGAAVEMH